MAGRKNIKIIDQRFGNCIVIERAPYIGNNLQVKCLCDCGRTFKTSAQQLKSGLTKMCPSCRKRKTRESREVERLKRLARIDVSAQKLTLMNSAKTRILRGNNGTYHYYDKSKAKIAARVMGGIAVPVAEAEERAAGRYQTTAPSTPPA